MQCPFCGAPLRPVRGRCSTCGGRLKAEMLPEGHALVVHAGTPLRDRAGSPAAVLQTLSRGDVVELLGREGTFLHVRLNGEMSGYVDAVNVRAAEAAPARPEPETLAVAAGSTIALERLAASPTAREEEVELPYGMSYLPGERLLYLGDFLYDPFKDRAFVVTSMRLILGGGGTVLPRVYELPEIISAGMREGSNGMALGERTIVLEILNLTREVYVAALRDPDTALARLHEAIRGLEPQPEPLPLVSEGM